MTISHSDLPARLARLESERHLAVRFGEWAKVTKLDREISAIKRRMHDEEFLRRVG